MATTPTIQDIVELLEKPLQLEAKQGFNNRAAVNGMAAYVGEWAQQGEHQGASREVREHFAALRRALAGYDTAGAEKRRASVESALTRLQRIRALAEGAHGSADEESSSRRTPVRARGAAGVAPPRAPMNRDADTAAPHPGPAPRHAGREKGTAPPPPQDGASPSRPRQAATLKRPRATATTPPVADWRELDGPYEASGRAKRPAWLDRLPKLGIHTQRDLLMHFPRDYVPYKRIADIADGERVCLRGAVLHRDVAVMRRSRYNSVHRYAVEIEDDSGKAWVTSFVSLSGGKRLPKWNPLTLPYEAGVRLFVEGTAKVWGEAVEIQYLEASTDAWADELEPGQVVPVYPLTEGIYQIYLRRAIKGLLERYADAAPEILPEALRREHRLCGIAEALRNLHWPDDEAALRRARRRLAFEEFVTIQLALAQRKAERQAVGTGNRLSARGDLITRLQEKLPFKLTRAQRRVIGEIESDMASDRPMNRLLQGDVGSGKTVVAVAALIAAVDNGYQGALMAPTEILAEQHYLVLSRYLAEFGIAADLLIGAVKKRDKARVYERVRSGETQVLIGTHALIQESLEFQRLGIVIVDEQHRFGVVQRAALRNKGLNPEVLVMTATPIPRTLALTVYGDLDVSALDEMPPGRRPVATRWTPTQRQDEAFAFVREQITQGRQAYLVCPLVEQSEKLEAEAAVRSHEELRTRVFPDLRLGLLHGRMNTAEKDAVMESFRGRETDILVSTTVIEVGVDVPNASVMVVLDAERFGLAQLHQLRGRVGRSGHQSHCIVITDGRYNPYLRSAGEDPAQEGRRRMRVIVEQTDGFVIAEEDLLLRGPGEFYGTRQHGLDDLRVARMGQDVALLEQARQAAFALVEKDPGLRAPAHKGLRERIAELRRRMDAAAP